MNQVTRRSALKGLAGILLAGTAPFYVPAKSLMRVKPIVVPREADFGFNCTFRFYQDKVLIREDTRWLPLSAKHAPYLEDIKKVARIDLYHSSQTVVWGRPIS